MLVEFDTAICAYHATRLLLYLSQYDRLQPATDLQSALDSSRVCLTVLRTWLSESSPAKTVISAMESLINHYSSVSRASLRDSPDEGEGHTPSREAQIATSRQRLAIHSLIRQAKFIDDSEEYTSPTTIPNALLEASFASPEHTVHALRSSLTDSAMERNAILEAQLDTQLPSETLEHDLAYGPTETGELRDDFDPFADPWLEFQDDWNNLQDLEGNYI